MGHTPTMFLVDSGASHNFVSAAWCKDRGVTVTPCSASVRLADGK